MAGIDSNTLARLGRHATVLAALQDQSHEVRHA